MASILPFPVSITNHTAPTNTALTPIGTINSRVIISGDTYNVNVTQDEHNIIKQIEYKHNDININNYHKNIHPLYYFINKYNHERYLPPIASILATNNNITIYNDIDANDANNDTNRLLIEQNDNNDNNDKYLYEGYYNKRDNKLKIFLGLLGTHSLKSTFELRIERVIDNNIKDINYSTYNNNKATTKTVKFIVNPEQDPELDPDPNQVQNFVNNLEDSNNIDIEALNEILDIIRNIIEANNSRTPMRGGTIGAVGNTGNIKLYNILNFMSYHIIFNNKIGNNIGYFKYNKSNKKFENGKYYLKKKEIKNKIEDDIGETVDEDTIYLLKHKNNFTLHETLNIVLIISGNALMKKDKTNENKKIFFGILYEKNNTNDNTTLKLSAIDDDDDLLMLLNPVGTPYLSFIDDKNKKLFPVIPYLIADKIDQTNDKLTLKFTMLYNKTINRERLINRFGPLYNKYDSTDRNNKIINLITDMLENNYNIDTSYNLPLKSNATNKKSIFKLFSNKYIDSDDNDDIEKRLEKLQGVCNLTNEQKEPFYNIITSCDDIFIDDTQNIFRLKIIFDHIKNINIGDFTRESITTPTINSLFCECFKETYFNSLLHSQNRKFNKPIIRSTGFDYYQEFKTYILSDNYLDDNTINPATLKFDNLNETHKEEFYDELTTNNDINDELRRDLLNLLRLQHIFSNSNKIDILNNLKRDLPTIMNLKPPTTKIDRKLVPLIEKLISNYFTDAIASVATTAVSSLLGSGAYGGAFGPTQIPGFPGVNFNEIIGLLDPGHVLHKSNLSNELSVDVGGGVKIPIIDYFTQRGKLNELNKLHSLIPGGIVARLGELGTDAQRKQQKERINKMLNGPERKLNEFIKKTIVNIDTIIKTTTVTGGVKSFESSIYKLDNHIYEMSTLDKIFSPPGNIDDIPEIKVESINQSIIELNKDNTPHTVEVPESKTIREKNNADFIFNGVKNVKYSLIKEYAQSNNIQTSAFPQISSNGVYTPNQQISNVGSPMVKEGPEYLIREFLLDSAKVSDLIQQPKYINSNIISTFKNEDYIIKLLSSMKCFEVMQSLKRMKEMTLVPISMSFTNPILDKIVNNYKPLFMTDIANQNPTFPLFQNKNLFKPGALGTGKLEILCDDQGKPTQQGLALP